MGVTFSFEADFSEFSMELCELLAIILKTKTSLTKWFYAVNRIASRNEVLGVYYSQIC